MPRGRFNVGDVNYQRSRANAPDLSDRVRRLIGERNAAIYDQFLDGKTLRQIAADNTFSYKRVWQIISKAKKYAAQFG